MKRKRDRQKVRKYYRGPCDASKVVVRRIEKVKRDGEETIVERKRAVKEKRGKRGWKKMKGRNRERVETANEAMKFHSSREELE